MSTLKYKSLWLFDWQCPLCMEAFDVDDLSFYPCTCGYQVCGVSWLNDWLLLLCSLWCYVTFCLVRMWCCFWGSLYWMEDLKMWNVDNVFEPCLRNALSFSSCWFANKILWIWNSCGYWTCGALMLGIFLCRWITSQ